jgi:hypothetical protein
LNSPRAPITDAARANNRRRAPIPTPRANTDAARHNRRGARHNRRGAR